MAAEREDGGIDGRERRRTCSQEREAEESMKTGTGRLKSEIRGRKRDLLLEDNGSLKGTCIRVRAA